MSKWWTHLDEKEYRKWRADEFATKARDEFARRRQPKPEPLPEPKEGGGGLLGGLKKLGGLALKPLEWEREHIAEPIMGLQEHAPWRKLPLPGPVERGIDILGAMQPGPAGALSLGQATKETPLAGVGRLEAEIAASPSTYLGLGAGGAMAKSVGLTRAAPAIAGLEDIAIGGPLFRAAGKGVVAPLRAATRRFAPDVPKAVGLKAKMISEATLRKWTTSVEKVGNLLKGTTRPAREATEELYRVERGQRFRAFEAKIEKEGVGGVAGAYGELAGELPSAARYQLPTEITGEDITNVIDVVLQSNIRTGDKVATLNAAFETLGVRRIGGKLAYTGAGKAPGLMGIARMEKVLGTAFADAARSQRTLGQKATSALAEAVNLPRAVLAAYDFSAPLRQGLLVPGADLTAWRQGVGAGIRAMFDEKYADDILRSMSDGTTGVYKGGVVAEKEILDASDVYISRLGGGLDTTEEQLQSRLAQYLPGIPMSERGYVVPLSKMRHSWLFHEVEKLEKQLGRSVNLSVASDRKAVGGIGKVVNAMTGRGDLPTILRNQQGLLSTIFFAPRLLWSRFQVPTMIFTKNAQVRKMVAKGVVGAAAANAGMLTAAAMAGKAAGWDMTVEHDPRSTDFGKIRVGPTRMDFLGGYQPIVRYATQLIMGERKTTVAGEMFPVDPKRVVTDFLRTKLSPVAGVGVDIATEETMLGDPVTGEIMMKEGEWEDYLQNHLVPMFIQDMKEAIAESGLAPGAFLALPGAFGGSVMSYAWPAQKLDTISQEVMGKKWKDLGTVQRKEFLEKSPEAQKIWVEYIEMNAKRGQDWAEGLWENLESYSEVETRLTEALASGANKADVAADYDDFRGSVAFDGDPDREPRDEQEGRTMGYYAIKKEDHRRDDGTTDFEAFYEAKRAYIDTIPETQEDFSRNEILKWKDPAMRAFVKEYQRSNDLWSQYYDIPSKLGMSPEEQREARGVLAQVTTLQFMNPGLSTRRALMQLDVPDRLKFLALRYSRLRSNPEREAFRAKYGTDMALIKPPEFGAAVTEEEAY